MSHEDFTPKSAARASSDAAFGLVFAAVFALIAFLPLAFGEPVRWWSAIVAAAFALFALGAPMVLAPLNRVWTRFGALLHGIVSPLVLGVMFYGVVLPTGIVMRIAGKDPLRLRFDPGAKTYWIDRVPPGPAPESFKDPF